MWFHQKYKSALAMGFGDTQMSPCALRTFSTQARAPCRALQQTQHFPKDAKQLTYGTLPSSSSTAHAKAKYLGLFIHS